MGTQKKRIVLIAALALGAFGAARVAWAGPYLFRAIELSPASSQKECGGQVVTILSKLQKEGRLAVDKGNPHLATTRASTVHVDCIFVGPNEQRRNQWIFYLAIASTDRQEAQSLLQLLRTSFRKLVRID